jgi:GntP family gluconate:H+ symporter
MALFIALLVSFWTLGASRGMSRATILKYTNDCLGPTATSTLLIGAGGGFGRILLDSGISTVMVRSGEALEPLGSDDGLDWSRC